jgi:hypothetical protein
LEGHVVNLHAGIPDNDVGKFNFEQNWGNTIVLQHPRGQYSSYSHLSYIDKNIFMGKWVNKGEVIGYCGNSGRSGNPHLHFQFQSTAKIGDKTIRIPLKKYLVHSGNSHFDLKICEFPKNEEVVSGIIQSARLAEAFNFPFGKELSVSGDINGNPMKEHWVSSVDLNNHTYLFCQETKALAYFFSKDGIFYFSDYFGNKDSLLNYFSLSASRIIFTEQTGVRYEDQLPLNRVSPALSNFWVDMIAPLQKVKEVQCQFQIKQNGDRTIVVENEISNVYELLPSKNRTFAETELSFPYGTQSIRMNANFKKSFITCCITC